MSQMTSLVKAVKACMQYGVSNGVGGVGWSGAALFAQWPRYLDYWPEPFDAN